MRIALIHALKHSVAPIEAAFARLWPEPVLANLLDDSLSADLAPLPVLKPNEAMIEDALTLAGPSARIGLVASFAPTLDSIPPEFTQMIPGATLVRCLASDALTALDRGDTAAHDTSVATAASGLRDCDVIALTQFSLARAAERVASATGRPVLTTPDSAVQKLKRLLA
jgi:hypothetical protein